MFVACIGEVEIEQGEHMKIMIVDDTAENLEAAKKASVDFSEHKFFFTNLARKALEMIMTMDAVITDLFFPSEDCGGLLGELYENYKTEMDNPIFFKVVDEYYGGDWNKAVQKREDAIALMKDGTIRHAVDGLIRIFKDRMKTDWSEWGIKINGENIKKYKKILQNLPAPEFPYGGVLILEAKKQGKFHCLVSDIHRHAGEYKDAVGSIDAMTLLIPLMGAGIITVEQARVDGEGSVTYIGGDEIWEIGKDKRKTSPEVWIRAIENCIVQKN